MADMAQSLADILECSLCLDTCAEPVSLPCFHTFCKVCLKSHIDKTDKRTFACPMCQSQYNCHDHESELYKPNFVFSKIKDIVNQFEDGTRASGISKTFEDGTQGAARKCQIHSGTAMMYFCRDCKIELCSKCVVMVEHKGHSLEILEDGIDKVKKDISGILEKLQEQDTNAMKSKAQIDYDITQAVQKCLKLLQERVDEVTACAAKWLADKTIEVKSIESKLRSDYKKVYEGFSKPMGQKTETVDSFSSSDELLCLERNKEVLAQLSKQLESYCNNMHYDIPALRISDSHIDLGNFIENDNRAESTFQLVIKDVSKLQDRVFSPPCYIRNLPWEISAEREKESDNTSLGVYLWCNRKSKSKLWSCKCKFEIRLLKSNTCNSPKTVELDHTYSSTSTSFGLPKFIEWNELLDPRKGYIKDDDSITLEVYCKADVPLVIVG